MFDSVRVIELCIVNHFPLDGVDFQRLDIVISK